MSNREEEERKRQSSNDQRRSVDRNEQSSLNSSADHTGGSGDHNQNQLPNEHQLTEETRTKDPKQTYLLFGGLCIAVAIAAFTFGSGGSSMVDVSEAAANALKNKVSTEVSTGTILASNDTSSEAMDYVIPHDSTAPETKIWVWDFAAEDGDYVQILVNGVPYSESFFIKHEPKAFTVPTVGDVQVKGIRDGGGGITYAVKFDMIGTTYFNSAPQNEFNTYTLVRK